MYKDKDGKVHASLTEVKNKTGDIFSLVDEYGMVTLTSYNKPKYVISKIDIAQTVGLSNEPESRENNANIINRLRTTVNSLVSHQIEEENTEETKYLIDASTIEALSKMKVWDRNSRKEKNYIQTIKRPLQ